MLCATGIPRRSNEESSTSSTLVMAQPSQRARQRTPQSDPDKPLHSDLCDLQQRRGVKHAYHLRNHFEAFFRYPQPRVECCNQLLPNVLPRMIKHVIVGSKQNLLFLGRPCCAVGVFHIVADTLWRIRAWWIGSRGCSVKLSPLRDPVCFGHWLQDGFRRRQKAITQTRRACSRWDGVG